MKEGRETSEWKAWMVAIAGSLAMGLGAFLTFGLVHDEPGFGAWEALTLAATLLASVGGVTLPTMAYNKGRVAQKLAEKAPPPAAPADPQ